MIVDSSEVALIKLLLRSFNVDELRDFIRQYHGEMEYSLPSAGSAEHIAAGTVRVLVDRGATDASLFRQLVEARPQRHHEILVCARLWGFEAADLPPPGVRAQGELPGQAQRFTGVLKKIGFAVGLLLIVAHDPERGDRETGISNPAPAPRLSFEDELCTQINRFRGSDPNTCLGNIATELVEASDLNLPIDNHAMNGAWDDKYNGEIRSMLCTNLIAPDTDINFVYDVRLTVAMDHHFVGDITIKVVAPDGTVLTVLSRPGAAVVPIPDDGAGCCGDSSNLLATHPFTLSDRATASSKNMGNGISEIEVICRDESSKIEPCQFKPYPGAGPGSAFSDFRGKAANGVWSVCFGDSNKDDHGKVRYIGLELVRVRYSPSQS
jgi:hypothetical protein